METAALMLLLLIVLIVAGTWALLREAEDERATAPLIPDWRAEDWRAGLD
ncbi:hypothetical protein [Deinococcus pimensis]|nr:hypothetical protein [Deinococcus pimensis]